MAYDVEIARRIEAGVKTVTMIDKMMEIVTVMFFGNLSPKTTLAAA